MQIITFAAIDIGSYEVLAGIFVGYFKKDAKHVHIQGFAKATGSGE